MVTQFVGVPVLPPVWANAGVARIEPISNISNSKPSFRILFLHMNCRQEVVDATLWEAGALTLNGRCQVSGLRCQENRFRSS
jgi:hypothetical protein